MDFDEIFQYECLCVCVIGTNGLAFGEHPDSFVDPGSFSGILYH